MARKNTITKHQANGALPEIDSKSSQSTYHILTKHRAPPYDTDSADEYLASLQKLTLVQLQDHAMEVGTVMPTDDRTRMIEKLSKEFAIYRSKVSGVTLPPRSALSGGSAASKSTEAILSKYRFGR